MDETGRMMAEQLYSTTLTPGRWLGLRRTSTGDAKFTILAFDHDEFYQRMLPENTTFAEACKIKEEVVMFSSPFVSAALLDPKYGFQAVLNLPRSIGLIMSLEKGDYTGSSIERHMQFDDRWTIAKMKRLGVNAVKLLVYYHPWGGQLTEESEILVERICQMCRKHDIAIFLEPMSYSLDMNMDKSEPAFAEKLPEIVRITAEKLSRLGPDVLKLEFPVNVAWTPSRSAWLTACEAISKASVVPWVLLSAGTPFQLFEQQVEIACKCGASGFLGGRAIWQDVIRSASHERIELLNSVVSKRLDRLAHLVKDYARPWTDFYSPIHPSHRWFDEY